MHVDYQGQSDFSLHYSFNGHYNTGVRVDDNVWHFIAMSADRNSVVSIYVDNDLQGIANISNQQGNIDNVSNFEIGYSGTQVYAFKGYLNDLRVYKRILLHSEISQIYNQTKNKYQ
ncbi:MAG: hypothetical protein PHP14_03445 [Candidatus Pacebacteria bacterium]|nr:hypothetical protein [Candidatus Paceibacterota bacterium]